MSTSTHLIGIGLAIASAFALSLGNIWQSRGVASPVPGKPGGAFFLRLIRTPVWLLGTAMFGLAIVLQMSSLAFAPLMLVQPIGVLALVFAVFFSSKMSGQKPSRGIIKAVGVTLIGVTAYVIVAATVSEQKPITDGQLVAVLLTLVGALLLAVSVAVIVRLRHSGIGHIPVVYVILGGMFSAFVATLGKTVILRVQAIFAGHHFDLDSGGLLTIACLIGLGIAALLSTYFVQKAYTCNPSDVVVAGLTVIDPAIAVVLGIVILQEAANAPLWSLPVIAIAGAVSVLGVLMLSKAEEAVPSVRKA